MLSALQHHLTLFPLQLGRKGSSRHGRMLLMSFLNFFALVLLHAQLGGFVCSQRLILPAANISCRAISLMPLGRVCSAVHSTVAGYEFLMQCSVGLSGVKVGQCGLHSQFKWEAFLLNQTCYLILDQWTTAALWRSHHGHFRHSSDFDTAAIVM